MKRCWREMFLSVLGVFLLVFPAAAQHLSLAQAIRTALGKNPQMTVATSRVAASRQRIAQARSGFLPRINFSESYTRSDNPPGVFATKLNQGIISQDDFNPATLNDPGSIDNFASNFSGTWSLYDSGQTWYSWHQARLGQKAASAMLQRTRQQVIAQTVEAYVGVLLARENRRVVKQTLQTARAHLNLVRSRYKRGFVVKSDYLRAQVQIANLEQQLLEAESRVEIARAVLDAAMGVAIDRQFELDGRLQSGSAVKNSLAHWIETAISRRTDFQQLEYQEEIARQEISKSKAAHLPSVNLVGNYQINTEKFDDKADNYTVGAVVNLNLFSGFQLSAKQKEAYAALAQVSAQRRLLKQQIQVETRRAYLQAQSAWQRIQVARSAVSQAEEALRIVGNRYNNGLFTIVDLLNSELALQQARTNRFRSVYDYKVARARLALAAGILDENFR